MCIFHSWNIWNVLVLKLCNNGLCSNVAPLFHQNLLGKKLTITGRNHYHVQVTCGEKIFFKREPDNSNDPNAIIVCTYERDIIGHLTKDDAKFYSRFLNFDTCVFGVLTRSAHGFYKTSMLVEKIMESPKYAVFNQWMFYSMSFVRLFNIPEMHTQTMKVLLIK